MIYIDASRYNNTKQRTGVENYSYFLINELTRLIPEDLELITPRPIDLDVRQRVIPFRRLWTQIRLSFEVWRNKQIDNLFVPSHLMPLIHPEKTTITIHDVAFKRFPESYGRLSRWYLHWGTKFAVKNAKNIIVPSGATKKDLIDFYQAEPQKITVIPLGFKASALELSEEKEEDILSKYHLKPRHYFLFVGRLETKKNLAVLLRAFESIHKKHPHLKLVLAGKPGRGYESLSLGDGIVETGFVSDEEKDVLLKNALAFVFPSSYEGFGLPLLEAMGAGIPIVASKIPSSIEIAKNNALFFEPIDQKTLEAHLKLLSEHNEWWEKLVQNHNDTLKHYSWEKCAKQTLDLLLR